MDMWLTIFVVLVVLAAIVVVALLAAQSRRRKQEQQRIEAAEHRHEADIRSASAQRREAEAGERAARAEHEQAQAREQAARARQDREVAEARHAAADRVDPDRRMDGDGRDTAEPAGRTDDLHMGAGRDEGRQREQGEPTPHWQTGGGWHGPTASGGFRAVDPAAPGPAVPSQRTGEHDRDQREPVEGEHSGPVRGIADRLLRRRG
jgi:hypothetical protein